VPPFDGRLGNKSMGTDIYLHAEKRSDGVWRHCGELTDLEDRNYQFFAILANVMNPIRTTVPFDCIVRPRGFPGDMSEELRHDGLLRFGHDPGWVTLRELLDFDWEGKTILRTAVVDPAVVHLFGDGKQQLPKGVYAIAHDGPGQRVTWVDTYKEAAGAEFLKKLFDTLARFGPPDDVRIVFSFDS
jgi:hypothetical protein